MGNLLKPMVILVHTENMPQDVTITANRMKLFVPSWNMIVKDITANMVHINVKRMMLRKKHSNHHCVVF